MTKPKVAIHSITGCAGCQLTIYFVKDLLLKLLEKIDLVAAPMLKEKNNAGPYDVCFMEGLVASKDDLEHLKKIREQSKILVALGTCATHGNVPGIKNSYSDSTVVESRVYKNLNLKEQIMPLKPAPIDAHVKVDYYISGCPPEEKEILKFITDLLLGKKPVIYDEPVCVECSLKENDCLLERGEECLGPMIRGGCDALCPSVNHGCTGCHGPLSDANILQGIKLLEQNGVDIKLIKKRFHKYSYDKFSELEEQAKKIKRKD